MPRSRSPFRLIRKIAHFGAAMVHEIAGLLPPLVPEADGGEAILRRESKAHLRTERFSRPTDDLPEDKLGALKLKYFHDDVAAVAEAENDDTAEIAVAFGVARAAPGALLEEAGDGLGAS